MVRPLFARPILSSLVVGVLSAVTLTVRADDRPAPPSSAPPAQAATAPLVGSVLSEGRALDEFRRENLELVAAKYDLSAQRAQTIAAGVWPNPTFGIGGAFLVHGEATGGKQELSLSLTQPLPIAGQVSLRRDAAEAYANAAERDFAAMTWFLAMEVRRSYLDVRIQQERVKLWQAAISDFQAALSIIDLRAQAGANPAYDRLRVSVEKRTLAGRAVESEADLVASRAALAQLLGPKVSAATLEVEGGLPDVPDAGIDVDGIVKRSLQQRPDLTAARLKLTAAELQVSALKRSYVPVPELGVGYTHAFNVPTGTGGAPGGMISAQLGIPLPIFDHGQGTIDKGRADADAARIRSRSAEWQVRRDAESAALVYRSRMAAWKAFRDGAMPDAERVRQIAELSYKEGRATILELLDAYRAHFDAKTRALELRAAAARSLIEVERVSGPPPSSPQSSP